VGTPSYLTINGNAIYSGKINTFDRDIVVNSLKKFYVDQLVSIQPIPKEEFPVIVAMWIFRVPGQANWDLDNLWIYRKAFLDALTESKIIPDDCIRYITGHTGPYFVPVDHLYREKFEIIIRADRRPVINEWINSLPKI